MGFLFLKKRNKKNKSIPDDEIRINFSSLDKLYDIDDEDINKKKKERKEKRKKNGAKNIKYYENKTMEYKYDKYCNRYDEYDWYDEDEKCVYSIDPQKKLTLKGNKTVLFQNISIILMITILYTGISSLRETARIEKAVENAKKMFFSAEKDYHPVEVSSRLVYDLKNDISRIGLGELSLISQIDEGLPNGCEAVAMTMLLNQFIPSLTPQEFIVNFLPMSPYLRNIDGIRVGDDPEFSYIGNPAGAGFGIFAAGLQTAAEACLKKYNIDKKSYNISGVSDEELFSYIDEDKYVVVWITMNMRPIVWGSPIWWLPSGKMYKWPSNQHCAVLKGYDEKSVFLHDPTYGAVEYDKGLFLSRWREMGPYEGRGRQAIVIY